MARVLLICVVASSFLLAALALPPTAESKQRRAFPRAGAVVAKPPLLRWQRVRAAELYNVQLFRNGRKILSRFPSRARLQLHRKWTYRGHAYRLRPAVYRWYVWPWLGSRYGRPVVRRRFIRGRVPMNVVLPTVAGRVQEGETLTATGGRWTGTRPMRFAYLWQRCGSAGTRCQGIAGAHGPSYRLVAADVDATVRALVTATNLARSRSAASHVTRGVLPAAPVLVSPPRIWGGLQRGRTVTADTGAWTSSRQLTYSFAWQRCTASGCRTISGATHQAYDLGATDFGRRVRAIVTASNAGGVRAAGSAISAVVGRVILGSGASDLLRGTSGADLIRSGRGTDYVSGRQGPDRISGGPGADRLLGGSGNDVIIATDRARDHVDCGRGRDRVVANRGDRLRHCEIVRRR
jgi:RTX calcium-binding nonapeptide repeat (4 copies)